MSLVELGKQLLDAAKRGDTDEVRTLMSNGAPFTTDWLGMSPLHFAARNGHFQTADVLLRAGISRDARTKVDRTPLHVASQEGHVTIVNLLLANSADIEAKDMLKMTPLHWATEKGHSTIVELLIKNGADVNVDDKFERTTLDIAHGNARQDILQLLHMGQNNPDLTGLTEGETVTIETTDTEALASAGIVSHVIEEIPSSVVGTPIMEAPSTPVPSSETKDATNLVPVTLVPTETASSKNENSEQSSTSVLATLAVLAEATAPFNAQNPSTAEAMSWLESQGITMISTNDAGILTSAVESGQPIALTEAGKMALNIFKQQGLPHTVADGETNDTVVDPVVETVVGDTNDQKVITIVTTDQAEEEPVIVTVTPDVSNEAALTVESAEEQPPPAKKCRVEAEEETTEAVQLDDILETTEAATPERPTVSEPDAQEELRRQLEEMKRQAESFKQQLMVKEQEAAVYKRQLSEMGIAKADMAHADLTASSGAGSGVVEESDMSVADSNAADNGNNEEGFDPSAAAEVTFVPGNIVVETVTISKDESVDIGADAGDDEAGAGGDGDVGEASTGSDGGGGANNDATSASVSIKDEPLTIKTEPV
ncbi:GA-binding protein subunit beta-1-like [Octopus sinensis]|uniref:GA-binding protein subunit beta-1-like n=1 Tax=Octopus sinensis TaxID=2607531 RepID=A0A6P7TXB5_9MOLL|nr:GA-binding protein subunit beta-1-like [Octopus sinensis]